MQDANVRPVRRVEVLGVPVDTVDMSAAVKIADQAVQQASEPLRILAVNPEKVFALRKDPTLQQFFASSELLIPDGIGVVWAARALYGVHIARVAGADLMQELCALAARKRYSIFLLGAAESVNARAARILEERYPGLQIAGRRNGYFAGDGEDVIRDINSSGASILFVALGSPKQERWIFQNSQRLSVQVVQGIGGTLDTIAGHVKRAPITWQRMHVEWLFRLINDPRRIRRQWVIPVFVWEVLMAKWNK